ncbi:MAG: rod shape-determining protein RodA [Puniceicoccales bacterium]|jgi:rod shape determining protein RodA|nr:rod shape-determining protein RodA [Puniceicoccales bacterium]
MKVVYGIKDRFISIVRLFFDKATDRSDYVSPVSMICLMAIGVLAIRSAENGSFVLAKMQIIWIIIGLLVYTFISCVDYNILMRNAHWIYGGCIILLLSLWTPLGARRFGSLRWINVGILLQPSEPAKIGTLIMMASLLARSNVGRVKYSLITLVKAGLILALPTLLIVLQPDLGSSLTFFPMAFSLLFISNLSIRFFISIFCSILFVIALVAADAYSYHIFLDSNKLNPYEAIGKYESRSILPLKDYQRNRIISFVAPDVVDPKGVGISWNLRQSLIAVGSGGLWGKGCGNGTQAKLGYLPRSVASNDFIFSVLAEEYGFMGGLIILILYVVLIGNGFRIASRSRDRFGMLLSVGASVILLVHVLINVGMTIGLMPITGIPLPFISYGGSFMLVCSILQGIVQSVFRFRKSYD